MKGDQGAGEDGRQRVFDHHDAVEGGGGEHDNGAKRRLHEAETDDAEPAKMPVAHEDIPKLRTVTWLIADRPLAAARIGCRAKAEISMPLT